jgi:chitin synthase
VDPQRVRERRGECVFFRRRRVGCGYWRGESTCYHGGTETNEQYNENNPAFPPPPIALPATTEVAAPGGQTLGQDEMDAILDSGWDDPPSNHPPNRSNGYTASPLHQSAYTEPPQSRYAANGTYEIGSYVPIDPPRHGDGPLTGDSVSSSVDSRMGGGGHAKKRSGGRAMGDKDRYGPLGPLADDNTGWGGTVNTGSKGWRQ